MIITVKQNKTKNNNDINYYSSFVSFWTKAIMFCIIIPREFWGVLIVFHSINKLGGEKLRI